MDDPGAGVSDDPGRLPSGVRSRLEELAGLGPAGVGSLLGAGASRALWADRTEALGAERSSGPGVAAHLGRTIVDFLTDGSLAALCEELTRIAGMTVELRDVDRRTIRFDLTSDSGVSWRLEDGEGPGVPAGSRWFPLTAGGEPIGWIVVHAGAEGASPGGGRIDRAVYYLAAAASELCEHELSLVHRVKEVELMYRLSALLARACSADRVLEEALDSALEVMQLDAGSVVLLPEGAEGVSTTDERELELKAARNLSEQWLTSPMPLSLDRQFDRLALAGEVVAVENLLEDERVQIPDRVRSESLVGFISAGLVFEGRPIGVFRLYARSARRFGEADRRLLRSIAEHSALAVEQARLLRLRAQEAQTQRQLDLAADVQQRMLPRVWPDVPGFDLAARNRASHRIGGDFYDVFEVRGRLGIAIGDMVGNGIAAALLMASTRTALRALATEHPDVAETISRVNQAMCRDTLQSEFATIWYAQIDPGSLEMRSCSAGHEPPILVRAHADGSYTDELMPTGGLVAGIQPDEIYEPFTTILNPGDLVVGYTDGLADARSFEGERFGTNRIRAAVRDALSEDPDANAQAVLERIFWSLRQFTGLHEASDDQTALVVRVTRQGR